jgi:D-amino-acid dehydrogenase
VTQPSPDIAVIGGGAIGLSIALDAARSGARVAVLERGATTGQECSACAAGLLNLTHLDPLANPAALRDGLRSLPRRDGPFRLHPRVAVLPWLARFVRAALTPRRVRAGSDLLHALGAESLRLHAQLAESGVATGLRRDGILYAALSERGMDELRHQTQALARYGIQLRLLAAAESQDQEPSLTPAIAGAAFCAGEAHIDPPGFTRAVSDEAGRLGVDVRTGTEVFALERSGRRVTRLETTAGPLRADTVVLAAGVGSGRVARSIGRRLPLEAGGGYYVDLGASDEDPRQPVYLHEARVVATPLADRLRLAGTFELGRHDERIDPIRIAAVQAAARRGLRALGDRPLLNAWRGLRPCPPDGLPYLGRYRDVDNLIVATGHGMAGLVLAPVTARIVTALAQGADPGHDLTLTSPDRFRRP